MPGAEARHPSDLRVRSLVARGSIGGKRGRDAALIEMERVNVVDRRQLALAPICLLLSRIRRCANDKLRCTSRASRSCGAPFAGIIGLRCHSYRPLLRF
jgi:hypothetical protein